MFRMASNELMSLYYNLYLQIINCTVIAVATYHLPTRMLVFLYFTNHPNLNGAYLLSSPV